MGYYPSKICCLLNIVILLGYGMIDCLVGGQVLSAVSDGSISVVAGIIIIAVLSWIIVVFGMNLFQVYERLVCYISFSLADSKFKLTAAHLGGHGHHSWWLSSCWLAALVPNSTPPSQLLEIKKLLMAIACPSFLSACRLR